MRHHPACRHSGSQCELGLQLRCGGNNDPAQWCTVFDMGHQAGLAAGEARIAEAIAEERARTLAFLKDREDYWGKQKDSPWQPYASIKRETYESCIDAIEAGEDLPAKAEGE